MFFISQIWRKYIVYFFILQAFAHLTPKNALITIIRALICGLFLIVFKKNVTLPFVTEVFA